MSLLLKVWRFLTGAKAAKVVKTAGDIVKEVDQLRNEIPPPPPSKTRSRYDD